MKGKKITKKTTGKRKRESQKDSNKRRKIEAIKQHKAETNQIKEEFEFKQTVEEEEQKIFQEFERIQKEEQESGSKYVPETLAKSNLSWKSLNLSDELVGVLQKHNYKKPTLIQQKLIESFLTGKDIMASSPPGTGKTIAYVLAALETLLRNQKIQSTAEPEKTETPKKSTKSKKDESSDDESDDEKAIDKSDSDSDVAENADSVKAQPAERVKDFSWVKKKLQEFNQKIKIMTICPTQGLASQIIDNFHKFLEYIPVKDSILVVDAAEILSNVSENVNCVRYISSSQAFRNQSDVEQKRDVILIGSASQLMEYMKLKIVFGKKKKKQAQKNPNQTTKQIQKKEKQYASQYDKEEIVVAKLPKLSVFIMDEADLLLSHYEKDLQEMVQVNFGTQFSSILVSATLNFQILPSLKYILMKHPEKIDLTNVALQVMNKSDAKSPSDLSGLANFPKLRQFYLVTNQGIADNLTPKLLNNVRFKHKFLIMRYILKYFILDHSERVLIFVNDIDNAFKLFLTLACFGFKKVLICAPEFPTISNAHILKKFNNNECSVLICVNQKDGFLFDDGFDFTKKSIERKFLVSLTKRFKEQKQKYEILKSFTKVENFGVTKSKKKDNSKKNEEKEEEKPKLDFNVENYSRGIDFSAVSYVVNFDLPNSVEEYVHIIGRTARGGKNGVSFAFLNEIEEKESKIWKDIQKNQHPIEIRKFNKNIAMEKVIELEYRYDCMEKQLNSVIPDAIIEHIQLELQNAEKLKAALRDPSKTATVSKKIDHFLISKFLDAVPSHIANEDNNLFEQKEIALPKELRFEDRHEMEPNEDDLKANAKKVDGTEEEESDDDDDEKEEKEEKDD